MADATFSTRPNLRLRTSVYAEAQSQEGNYTVYRVQLYLVETAQQSSFSATPSDNSWSMSVNGVNYGGNFTYDARPSGNQSWLLLNTTVNFGHDAAGYIGGVGYAASASSATLGGANTPVEYAYAARIPKPPAPPSMYAATATNSVGVIQSNFSGDGDSGGSAIIDYVLQWSWDAAFTVNVAQMATTNGAQQISGLEVGRTYYLRVLARNAIGNSNWSSTASVVAPGHPGAPTSVSAAASTTSTGRINITWAQPAVVGAGGIVGYTIFRDGTQIGTTTGTGGAYTDVGVTPFTQHSYNVAARNNFSSTVGGTGDWSAAAVVTAQGPPTAPSNLVGTADPAVPGKIDLSWSAPTTSGAGGITGYRIRFSTNAVALTTSGGATSASVTGLNPGQVYSFKVHALNALANAEGSESPASNTYTVQALGEPPAPNNFAITAVPTVAGRVVLTWTPPAGGVTSYSVFSRNTTTGVDTLLANIKSVTYTVDGLAPGYMATFVVRSRNSYTDTLSTGYPGNWGGPASAPVQTVPYGDITQYVNYAVSATDVTNLAFNGTYAVTAVTPTTIRYTKAGTNVPLTAVNSGTVVNNTNAVLNGSYTVATPTPNTLTYTKVGTNIAPATVSGGSLTDTTNASFNGYRVVTAINLGSRTVSFARNDVAVASTSVPQSTVLAASGYISNTTNAVYNTTTDATIIGWGPTMIQYAKTNVNLPESNAAGTVTDTTNRDYYNGTYIITSVPTYNTFTFSTVGPKQGPNQANVSTAPGRAETARRALSPSQLDVKYRSGWAG
jgi:hypothetical protein